MWPSSLFIRKVPYFFRLSSLLWFQQKKQKKCCTTCSANILFQLPWVYLYNNFVKMHCKTIPQTRKKTDKINQWTINGELFTNPCYNHSWWRLQIKSKCLSFTGNTKNTRSRTLQNVLLIFGGSKRSGTHVAWYCLQISWKCNFKKATWNKGKQVST